MATSQKPDATLTQARAALERRAWREAFDLFSSADAAEELAPEDLEALAKAADALGDFNAVIDAYQRAHAGYMAQGQQEQAAVTALHLVPWYAMIGDFAVSGGWRGTAERLLEELPESAGHAQLALMRASFDGLAKGDLDTAVQQGELAVEIARRVGDRDVEMRGLNLRGRALLKRGEVEAGMALLDETMAVAIAGELGPFAATAILCGTIAACREVFDYHRAGEWTEAAERAGARQGLVIMPGHCRLEHAVILRMRGQWAEAEGEARNACEAFGSFERPYLGLGWNEIGEIRRCLGDFAGAEAALERANEIGVSPQPGLALLRLAEGKVDAAAVMIKRALAEDATGPLVRARILPAQVEIAIAAGDLETARSAAKEQQTIAETYRTPALQAAAACAQGALQLADGDAAAACGNLRRGWLLWQEVGAPYETARARMMLAEAYRSEGDEEAAALELRAARSAFTRLGAALAAERSTELLGAEAAATAAAPGRRAIKTFMFTDIVRSTALVDAMGDEAWEDLLSWHDQTLRAVFVEHAGDEIKVTHEGDGFFVAFEDAVTAVACAVDIQRSLAKHRRTNGFAPQVRIGLHTVEATRRGRDFGGKGVHEAARIAGLASGGEIVVGEETLAAEPLPFSTSELRFVNLKGISEPVGVAMIEWR